MVYGPPFTHGQPVTNPPVHGGLLPEHGKPIGSVTPFSFAGGDFADPGLWVGTGGWSVSGGAGQGVSAASSLRRNIDPLTTGQSYSFSFTFTKSGGDKLRINTLADGSGNGDFVSATLVNVNDGTITGTFVASGPAFMIQADTAPFTGTIDNLTVTKL